MPPLPPFPCAALLLCMAALCPWLVGCASTRQEATVERERVVGVQGGQPTDYTRTREQQTKEEARSTVDTAEVARVTAEAATKGAQAAIAAAIPGLGQALASAIPQPPKIDLAPVLGGLNDSAKVFQDMRAAFEAAAARAQEADKEDSKARADAMAKADDLARDLEEVKKSTASKPTGPGDLAAAGLGILTVAASGWAARERRRANDETARASDNERHLKETVAGVEAAKGVLPPQQWAVLTNALQTRQSSDTQARIDNLTP